MVLYSVYPSYKHNLSLIQSAILHSLFQDPKACQYTWKNWVNYGASFFQTTPYLPTTPALTILCRLKNSLEAEACLPLKEREAKRNSANKFFHEFFRPHIPYTSQNTSQQDAGQQALKEFFNKHGSFYKLLEINPIAVDEEIKNGFKKLALIYHPDRNPGTEANEKFAIISYAKECLLNPALRKLHDDCIHTLLPNQVISITI